MMRKTILRIPQFLFALILCASAQAESLGPFDIVENKALAEYWINPGFYSYHFQTEKRLNNGNYGLGVEYRYSSVNSFTAGRFFNSDRQYSNYAGCYWQPLAYGAIRLGGVIGVFNGYPKMLNGGWFVAIIPVASIEHGRIGLNLAFVPTYKDRLYGALSFQLKVRVD